MKTFKYLRLFIVGLAISLCLNACRVSVSPVESAMAKTLNNGVPENVWTLSTEQVAKLNVWLGKNTGGWDETRNQHVPNLLVNLKHKDGQSSTLAIAGRYVVLSFNGELHAQKFDKEDIVDLQTLLGLR